MRWYEGKSSSAIVDINSIMSVHALVLSTTVSILPALKVKVMVKLKVWTLVIAPLIWVRLATSSALQSRKWLV